MKSKLKFKSQNLLYYAADLKGPIMQVLFAKQFTEYEGAFSFNRLARVIFKNAEMNKAFPGSVPLKETLLLGEEGYNFSTLHLCIRGNNATCRIATGYCPKRVVILHDEYRQVILLQKLTDKEIHEIFTYVWDHPETIQPFNKPLTNDN